MASTSAGFGNSFPGADEETFYSDVAKIMRGYGDSANPIRESVVFLCKILTQQMKGIMREIIELTLSRGSNTPMQEDFEFLMRKNPIKIARMQKYLKDAAFIKKKARIIFPNNEEVYTYDHSEEEEIEREIIEKHDEEKNRRLFRADRIAQILTEEEHLKFNESRRTMFLARQFPIMKAQIINWLKLPSEPDIILSNKCLTIISYLAHETIATIVDYSILTRLNSSNRITSPYNWSSCSGTSYNMMHLCPEVTQGRGLDGIKAITVGEIQEAMRRFAMSSRTSLGNFRNMNYNTIYLAF